MEEGIFPGHKSMDNPEDVEEERRLFYVGITRAKQNLYMTFAKGEQSLVQQVIIRHLDL